MKEKQRWATMQGLTREEIKNIPIVTPECEWQVTYQKGLPRIITDIKFIKGFYNANAEEQEDKLKDLWKSVKDYRKERREGLIID